MRRSMSELSLRTMPVTGSGNSLATIASFRESVYGAVQTGFPGNGARALQAFSRHVLKRKPHPSPGAIHPHEAQTTNEYTGLRRRGSVG